MPKALIVDDEPEANELLAMLVQLRGYETSSAFTGNQAREAVGRSRPDLVFLDLMLPDVNGFDLCRQWKAQRATSGIPVLMVTARLAAQNRVEGFRVGATDYVAKPYTPDQIFAAMAGANAWRSDLDETNLEGVISIDARSEVAHLRELSRLRSLLLDRTSLSEDVVGRLDQTLGNLASRAIEWGLQTGQNQVASLAFRGDSEGIVFHLTDESGWFVSRSSRLEELSGELTELGIFDEVVSNPRQQQLTLTRLFSTSILNLPPSVS